MKVDHGPDFRLSGVRAVQPMIDRQEVFLGKLVGPFHLESLSAARLDGRARPGSPKGPQSGGGKIAMQLGLGLAHGDAIEGSAFFLPWKRSSPEAFRHGRNGKRVDELGERVGVELRNPLVLGRGSARCCRGLKKLSSGYGH